MLSLRAAMMVKRISKYPMPLRFFRRQAYGFPVPKGNMAATGERWPFSEHHQQVAVTHRLVSGIVSNIVKRAVHGPTRLRLARPFRARPKYRR